MTQTPEPGLPPGAFRAAAKAVVNHLRLFRADAAVFAFGSYSAGGFLAPAPGFDPLAGALVTLASANFCYSFNAWTDRASDAINKPGRPIPSGQVSAGGALRYSLALFALSLVYPFLITRDPERLFWYLLIPFLGLFYSARPFRLKNRPPFSVLTVAAGLTIPFILGYADRGGGSELNGFFLAVFLFCTALVGLKDIEDERGDTAVGERNLYHMFGLRLLDASLVGLAFTLALSWLLPMPLKLSLFMTGQCAATAACILLHRLRPLNRARLYRRVIKTVIVVGTVFWSVILREALLVAAAGWLGIGA